MAFCRVALLHFFCILLFLAFSTPGRAQARESQFFSKAVRHTAPNEATAAKEEQLPSAAKKDEEVQYKPDNGGGGYGLYGHGPDKIPAAATARPAFPTYSYNNGAGAENFNTESVPGAKFNEELDGVSYGNKEYFNADGHPDNKNYAGNTPTYDAGSINPENYELNGYNKEASTRHPSHANPGEQYGMSDTRFLDNGRYFYDLKAENSFPGKYDPAGYGSFEGGQTFANGGYRFDNNMNRNNNNNNNEESSGYGYEENKYSMHGYGNNQREEYVP